MSEELEKTVRIERHNFCLGFESLSLMKVTTDLTFFNDHTSTEFDTIQYDLSEYRQCLKILDTNGEILEYSKSSLAGTNGFSDYLIDIKLPLGRELKPLSRRTLSFQYFSQEVGSQDDSKYDNPSFLILLFPVAANSNTYVAMEPPDHLRIEAYGDVLEENGEEISELELQAMLHDNNLIQNGGEGGLAYLSIKGGERNRFLRVYCRLKAPTKLLKWAKMGKLFGLASAIGLPVVFFYGLITNNLHDLIIFVSFPVFVITFLVVIKGWIFLKDLDSTLEDFDEDYSWIVKIIMAELFIIMAIIAVIQNPNIPNIHNVTDPIKLLNDTSTNLKCFDPSIIGSYNNNSSIDIIIGNGKS